MTPKPPRSGSGIVKTLIGLLVIIAFIRAYPVVTLVLISLVIAILITIVIVARRKPKELNETESQTKWELEREALINKNRTQAETLRQKWGNRDERGHT